MITTFFYNTQAGCTSLIKIKKTGIKCAETSHCISQANNFITLNQYKKSWLK